jgi:hypothetical protein
MKNLDIGGFAAIVLVCAAAALAQTTPDQTSPPGTPSQNDGALSSQVNPPQDAAPAEKPTAQQINAQGANGTTKSVVVSNDEAPATGAPASIIPQSFTP